MESFAPYEGYSEYSPHGRAFTSNPIINMMLSGLMQHNYTPRPASGQDMHDAFLERYRSAEILNMQTNAFRSSPFAQKMGLGNNPALGAMGRYLGSPDSALSQFMSPFIGGNPAAAHMQMYAGFQGAQIMGNFGRTKGISARETGKVLEEGNKNLYEYQEYEGPGGVKEEIREEGRKYLRDLYSQGEKGRKHAMDMGFNLDVDKSGKLTAEGEKQLQTIDITNDAYTRKVKNAVSNRAMEANELGGDYEQMMREDDKEKKKLLKERFEKKLKDYNVATNEQIKRLKGDKYENKEDINQLIERHKSMSEIEEKALSAKDYEKAGGRYGSFNFEKSRGFKQEDFVSAFYKAADARMLGDTKGMSIKQAYRDFTENAGGTMSAGRALFGSDKSAGEIFESLSDLVGTGQIDTRTKEGNDRAEKLLRDIKSTASVTGISTQSMLSLIETNKRSAQIDPNTGGPSVYSNISGSVLAQNAMKIATQTAAIGANMSASDYRAAGGSTGIAAQLQREETAARNDPGARMRAVALSEAYGQSKEKGDALAARMKGGEFSTYELLRQGGANRLADDLGVSINQLKKRANSDSIVRGALQDEKVAQGISESSMNLQVNDFWKSTARLKNSFTEDDMVKELAEEKKRAESEGREVDLTAFANKIRAKLPNRKAQSNFDSRQLNIVQRLNEKADPEAAEMAKELSQSVEERTASATALDKRLGYANAPIVTQVIGALTSGKDTKDKAKAFKSIFVTDDEDLQKAEVGMPGAREQMEQAQKAGEQLVSKGKGITDINKLVDKGITEDINKFLTGQKAYATAAGDKERASKIKEVSAEELKESVETVKNMEGVDTVEAAKDELEGLRAQQKDNKLDPQSSKRLRALETEEKMGLLESQRAHDLYRKGLVGAAVTQGQSDAAKEYRLRKQEGIQLGSLEKRVDRLGKKGDAYTQEFIKQYGTDGHVSQEQLRKGLKDFEEGSGMFEKFAHDEKAQKLFSKSGLGRNLASTSSSMSKLQEDMAAGGASAGAGEQAGGMMGPVMDKLQEILKPLLDVLQTGGTIGQSLQALAAKL